MILLDWLYHYFIAKRQQVINHYKNNPLADQERSFLKVLNELKSSDYGRTYEAHKINDYQTYADKLPFIDYKDLVEYITPAKIDKPGVLMSIKPYQVASTSGTVSGVKKYIPVSKSYLKRNHFSGGKDLLTIFSQFYPKQNLYKGHTLYLGGAFEDYFGPYLTGDMSAIIMKDLPFWVRFRAAIPHKIAVCNDWNKKLKYMMPIISKKDVRVLSGVPSWVLKVIQCVMDYTQKQSIFDIWPNLSLYIHGGVSFEIYEPEFKKLFGQKVCFLECYNSTEGFFAVQDNPYEEGMLLRTNHDIFYEFENLDSGKSSKLSGVKKKQIYKIIISSTSGLYRYKINDLIEFVSTNPYKLKVVGRVTESINLAGEKVLLKHFNSAIAQLAQELDFLIEDFTVSPYISKSLKKMYYQFFVEFIKPPTHLFEFEQKLDDYLQQENRDYKVKRQSNLLINPLQVIPLKQGTFYEYLKQKKQLGGQHKTIKMQTDNTFSNQIIRINETL